MPKGQPEKGYAMTPQREKVLRILAAAGGSLDDDAGLVVSKLRERTGHDNTQALSMVIKQLEQSGLIKRDVTGRRTYHIEIVPGALAPEDRQLLGINGQNGSVGSDETVASHEPTVLLEDDGPDETPNPEGTDYRRLADELLKSALAAIAHKSGDPKLKMKLLDAESRVAEYQERVKDLESRLLDRGEEMLRLQESLRVAEHNLKVVQAAKERQKAQRGSDSVSAKLTDRERRELEDLKRIMQERPQN